MLSMLLPLVARNGMAIEHHKNSEVRIFWLHCGVLESSRMFMVSDLKDRVSVPLLGDISPDYPNGCLLSLLLAARKADRLKALW